MKFGWKIVVCLILLFALILGTRQNIAYGQAGTSTIRGTVTDPSGAAVAHAHVAISNSSGFARSQETTTTGAYSFELIPVGDYQLAVEAAGFRKAEFRDVHALVGNTMTVDAKLEVGSAKEIVQVEAGGTSVQINTQDATLGNTIVSEQITQLPMEARNVLSLLTLQPGVTPDGSVAGARSDQSNITLDGVDINDAQDNSISGPVLRLNAEAIEEFRVTTVNSNADEGRSSAAQINLVTKSGSNTWHGAAFEFYRGTLFEANNFFNNSAGVPVPHLVRNTFGGALGGPIIKDRLFFFYSYEGRRDATATPVTEVVPLPSLGQGIINYNYCTDSSCNTVANASLNATQVQQAYSDAGINPAALSALAAAAAKYPANDTSQGDGLNTSGFRFNAPQPVSLNSHFAKIDLVINHHQNLFVRLNYINDHVADPVNLQAYPDTVVPQIWNHPTGLAVGHIWTIGNNIVNNLRYGLTRQSFTAGGDSFGNDISFRFVFQPTDQVHGGSRVTPVHNLRDDLSWVHGRHVFQFGANIRKINNERVSFGNAFDNAVTNPSFYAGAGDHVSQAFQDYLDANGLPGDENADQLLNSNAEVQNAATAIIGRLSQYTANFTFGKDGSLLNPGVPTDRNFATQAYDGYAQDSWKIRPHFTLTFGLRYSLERPVYETQGFEVQPTVPLGTYFQDRLDSAAKGTNFTDPIVINRSGPANGGKPMYNWDKNNFQPRLAVAWSPSFSKGLFHSIFGDAGKSVIRSGFALTNDYYGQALAVDFDLNNTLGFTSNYTTPANTYDTSAGNLAPPFTGFDQDIHKLENVVVPPSLVFPLAQPSDEGERIESSVDSKLQAPTEYVWNLTYERQFKAGTTLTVSYIGRSARHLLARRDVAAFNDIVDTKTGMDWYTAGTMLEKQRQQGTNTSQIATIPFFEDLFPAGMASLMNGTFGLDPTCSGGNAGFDPTWSNTQVFYAMQSRTPSNPCAFFAGNDWTDTQALVDQVLAATGAGPTRFMQPQYGALSAWSTIGNSNYNAMTVTLRQRLKSLTADFNYTYSHSLDDASGLQNAGAYGSAFIVNPIRQRDWYGNSDFDIRHLITASGVWQMPFGRGQHFGNSMSRALDAIVGGWQLTGILRYNSGLPETTAPYDDSRWATNWNVQADVTPTVPISACSSRTGTPKLFGGCDLKTIYDGFRNAYPGETGPRNWLRLPGYVNADMGLGKLFTMPWSEKQTLQFRWEVFNVANYQPMGGIDTSRTGFGIQRDPGLRGLNPPSNWSNYTSIQGNPRVMQVGLRFAF
jgi:Carboxypeptidase regulatory-like domain